jgi:hypothetical protein
MQSILLKKKDIVRGIVSRFQDYLLEWKKEPSTREKVYMRATADRIILEKYGVFPARAAMFYNMMTVHHLGKTVEEIENITNKFASNNVIIAKLRKEDQKFQEIPEEDMKIITEYHSYTFAGLPERVKNPFNV